MADLTTVTLEQLGPFAPLGDIARRFKVELTLFGGAASRAAMYITYQPTKQPDLFDLAPFSSDIDIAHTGTKELTPEIRQAIGETIPFASWCRWAILDRESAKAAAVNRASSTYVPLRSITFKTGSLSKLPLYAAPDLAQRQITFRRNPNFASSALARQGRDLEVFGLLLALNTLADMREIADGGELRDHARALAWMKADETFTELARADAPALRMRLWHMLAPMLARGQPSPLVAEFANRIANMQLIEDLNLDLKSTVYGAAPFTVSKPTSGGRFRVPNVSPQLFLDERATYEFHTRWSNRPGADRPVIDPAFELIGFIPDITVLADAGGDEQEGYFSGADADFLHLSWSPNNPGIDPAGLTGAVLPHIVLPGPTNWNGLAVGGLFASQRAWLRVDVSHCAAASRSVAASLLILQARDDHE